MTQDYGNLRVPEEALEVARESKRDDETWGEFIQRCAENPPPVREFVDAGEIDDAMQSIDAAAFNGALDDETADEILATLESLPKDTADEVEARLR